MLLSEPLGNYVLGKLAEVDTRIGNHPILQNGLVIGFHELFIIFSQRYNLTLLVVLIIR